VMAMPETYPIQRAMTAAGIIDGPPHPQEVPAPDAWLSRLAAFPLLTQPGERWHYNTASDILGVLIMRASGQPFETFLRERIFEPLGMTDTGFSVSPKKIDRLATSYETNLETGEIAIYDEAAGGQWSTPPAFASGAGGLVSTADDIFRFARMLHDNGAYGASGESGSRDRIVSRAAIETMTTDQLTPTQKVATGVDMDIFGIDGWGFGVAVATKRDNIFTTPGRYGWDGGLGTSWANDPAHDQTGILLTQVAWNSPNPPVVWNDFWTSAYAAIDD